MNDLHDVRINEKLKLGALWASVTLCYLYGDYFELYVPDKVARMVSGDNNLDTPLKLFIAAFALLVPSMMVCLSVMLRASLNRTLNMVVGGIFAIFVGLVGASSLSDWHAYYVLYASAEMCLTLLIVRVAWAWERIDA